MPFVTVETNLSYENLPHEFGSQFSSSLAEILNKPIERVSVTIVTDQRMWRGGSSAPIMQVSISAIGSFSEDTTASYCEKITSFLQSKTSLPLDRIVIVFIPIQPWQVGRNGTVVV